MNPYFISSLLGWDYLFDFVFALITLAVAVFSFRLYRIAGERKLKALGLGFLLISFSYLVLGVVNFARFDLLDGLLFEVVKMTSLGTFDDAGLYIYMALYLTGLLTLTFMQYSKEKGAYLLLFLVTMVSFLLSGEFFYYHFTVISSIFLSYIIYFYWVSYRRSRQHQVLLVMMAFVFLLVGRLHFLISTEVPVFYTLAHATILAGYLLMLYSLIAIIRKK